MKRTNHCILCDCPIKGRRKKCDACRDLCNMCNKPARRIPSGGLHCTPCRSIKVAARTYGLTLEDAADMRTRGVCDVCGSDGTEYSRALHIDHDHETGKVRGLLCNGCNLALGNVKDSPSILRALANYLEASDA